jgi:hypothetical protein
MNIQRWIARREPDWKILGQLLTQVEKKGLKLSPIIFPLNLTFSLSSCMLPSYFDKY